MQGATETKRSGVRRDGNLSSSIHDEHMNVKAFKKRATVLRAVETDADSTCTF